ncbi:MAG: 16S rRNA (cytosine(1402)-N(4))-methyltransferase RsmH [Oscillospiraceae bacterium]|nr:16S rRNA (cytosine(1402)-N(4))-methyltransferase RsmH [Oscillospiraceae bacterium]
MTFHHETVLLREAVAALRPSPGGAWLDGTAGGGGHTALLLESIEREGRILAVDRDPDAILALRERFANEPAITIYQGNFFQAVRFVEEPLRGALLDLGASSHQFDTPARGFSYHREAPLDCRMSREGVSAAGLVNSLPEGGLRQIFWDYGQEKYANRIARAIVLARENAPIETTTQLAALIANAVPAAARRDGHPARKAFMALRYACNGELDGLEEALLDLFGLLLPGGRLAVITFNSLEDAAVKRVTKKLRAGCQCPPEFPKCVCGVTPKARMPQKPLTPSAEELARNPRARSAKLRVLEKL